MAIAGPNVRRLASSGSIPAGGFTPGTILLSRYRIIGLLGRGGMGEVYRADDLKLGQAVALKFLPPALAEDPVRRERFFAEVRITRQVSHPNICRVYDIAELEDSTTKQPRSFLTMEYIDGEDLASLLQRIGYLSNEKALDLARQLVAGLAAAHERGVLHRDLKPANIMVDGRGRVRITDFGLAIAASDESQAIEVAGTPAYMAPEQLAGKGATVRSDIYALGLVLYELYTGKRAFASATLAELRQQKESTVPLAPSESRADVDAIVERVIVRCLERDPRSRPGSVAQVAAALPGGDPLAAVLAAGETPSPEMVAAAGAREALGLSAAMILLVLGAVGIAAAAVVGPSAKFLRLAQLSTAPAVLAARADSLLRAAGYAEPVASRHYGFIIDQQLIDFARREEAGRRALRSVGPAVFWYRSSPTPLARTFMGSNGTLATGGVTVGDPVVEKPGESLVILDSSGRLRFLQTIPILRRDDKGVARALDWHQLFEYAGLESSGWTEVEPNFVPEVFADQLAAWEGRFENAPVRIEAASYRGRPVLFRVVAPWRDTATQPPTLKFTNTLIAVMMVVMTAAGAFFAHLNVRSGRGDRRGASRIVMLFASLWSAAWIVSEDHVDSLSELNSLMLFASLLALTMALIWVVYVALEPFVRRQWPQVLVSWTRLLRGEWRDPLVGRDVLIGTVAGIGVIIYVGVIQDVPAWLGQPVGAFSDVPSTLQAIDGAGSFLGALLETPTKAVAYVLAPLFFVFLFSALFRRQWIAAFVVVGFFGTLTAAGAYGVDPTVLWAFAFPTWAFRMWILVRFGLLTYAASEVTALLLFEFPVTADSSAWYASVGFTVIGVLAAMLLYGFRTSLGGRRVFELADG